MEKMKCNYVFMGRNPHVAAYGRRIRADDFSYSPTSKFPKDSAANL